MKFLKINGVHTYMMTYKGLKKAIDKISIKYGIA